VLRSRRAAATEDEKFPFGIVQLARPHSRVNVIATADSRARVVGGSLRISFALKAKASVANA